MYIESQVTKDNDRMVLKKNNRKKRILESAPLRNLDKKSST